jgi:hypothetical protein
MWDFAEGTFVRRMSPAHVPRIRATLTQRRAKASQNFCGDEIELNEFYSTAKNPRVPFLRPPEGSQKDTLCEGLTEQQKTVLPFPEQNSARAANLAVKREIIRGEAKRAVI